MRSWRTLCVVLMFALATLLLLHHAIPHGGASSCTACLAQQRTALPSLPQAMADPPAENPRAAEPPRSLAPRPHAEPGRPCAGRAPPVGLS